MPEDIAEAAWTMQSRVDDVDLDAIEAKFPRGADGWVNPIEYKAAHDAWVAGARRTEDFLRAFPPERFVNPSPENNWLPRFLRNPASPALADEVIFGQVFTSWGWGGKESRSGWGSDLVHTVRVLRELPSILRRLGVRSLVDAPCGDMNWMRRLDYHFASYIGVDVVRDIIQNLLAEKWPDPFHFQVGNITTDILPQADAVLCRDCLVHLPYWKIQRATHLFKRAGIRYLICTTFTARTENTDCDTGDWRPLNMAIAPFFWGEPLLVLQEREPGEISDFADKSLGVWSVDALPLERSE